jgi:hypothetical protein
MHSEHLSQKENQDTVFFLVVRFGFGFGGTEV